MNQSRFSNVKRDRPAISQRKLRYREAKQTAAVRVRRPGLEENWIAGDPGLPPAGRRSSSDIMVRVYHVLQSTIELKPARVMWTSSLHLANASLGPLGQQHLRVFQAQIFLKPLTLSPLKAVRLR